MLNWNHKEAIKEIVHVLKNDEIVLAQSDTILGLFGRLSQRSKEKLDAIKKRNLKPYIILIKSADLLSHYTDQKLDTTMQQIIDQYWPGPLTILFKAKQNLPDWMIGQQGTIALRVPQHEGLQHILEKVEGVFTTSANISDQPVPHVYADIDPIILQQIQLVCCDPCATYDGKASTILDFSSGSIKIIRSGAILIDSI